MAGSGGGAPDKPLAIATRSLLGVLRNRDIGSLELSWTLGVAADWALLVVALLVAYDAGGAVLVGLVSLTRMLPATVVNLVVDTSRFRRPERALVGVNLVRAAGAALVAGASVADATVLVFAAVAAASAAGALVRPTVLTLLPQVATSPAELVSANTAGALGESAGTFVGPLLAGLVIAQLGAAPAALVVGRVVRAGGRGRAGRTGPRCLAPVPAGTASPAVDPVRGRHPGAGRAAAGRDGDDVAVRADRRARRAHDVHRHPRPRGPGHGRRGRRDPRRGHRAGRDRRRAWRRWVSGPSAGWRPCS